MSTEFKNEVFSSYDPNPIRVCSYCGGRPALLRSMLDTQSGRTVRMFKCNCGEQTWLEDKKSDQLAPVLAPRE
jgi:formate dehydrogenase maturation protein FdhE